MDELEQELHSTLEGEVKFDLFTQAIYSVDASIFEVKPIGVVIPKSKADLKKIVDIAKKYHVSLIARGAATGITGGCLGRGLVVDCSKYLHRILALDVSNETVTCEPGVVQDTLNHFLSKHGYRLGPDTSTGNRATLGGMLANNAAGARSLHFGKMVDHIVSLELLLSSSEFFRFQQLSQEDFDRKMAQSNSEGRLYREIQNIRQEYASDIQSHFPQIPRRVSGYNLDELIKPSPLNIAKLIVGSEGTLGIVTEMTLKIVPLLKKTGLCLIFFDNMNEAFQAVPQLLQYHPVSLEMIDDQIMTLGKESPSLKGRLNWLPDHDYKLFLTIEFERESNDQLLKKIHDFVEEMQKMRIGKCTIPLLDEESIQQVWALRKAGLGILMSKRGFSRAVAFIEDISIAPEKLAAFMAQFLEYIRIKGKTAGIYGHVGSGCMHIRPYMNLYKSSEVELMRTMMKDVAQLLLEFQGSLSGEHGDGLIRSWLNPILFGSRIMEAFKRLKHAFDSEGMMNPGKIIPPSDQWEDLRFQQKKAFYRPETYLNFDAEGGFVLAVDLCNGNGLCRKKERLMCPSFQVTNDEFHSTRARAQSLRSIIHGRLPKESFTSKEMYDVMDLCLSCKGCKTECPSQVDMAKMKSEFLFHYQEKHGYSLRSRLFASIAQLNHWMSLFSTLVLPLQNSFLSKKIFSWIGIAPERSLPKLSKQKFSDWIVQYHQKGELKEQVILWNDTFNEYNHPEVGHSAVKILNRLGYNVIVPRFTCCGRPAFSKGFLKKARDQACEVVKTLKPYMELNIPIIGLEPSCLLMIKDDYPGLITSAEINLLVERCITLEEFLDGIDEQILRRTFKSCEEKKIWVHGHCHQKAMIGMKPTLNLLKKIPGFEVKEIDSGCCGMAGSFGYEKEHYQISMSIGELVLFPKVRETFEDEIILASGSSCREQILEGTGRRAYHLAEVLFNQI